MFDKVYIGVCIIIDGRFFGNVFDFLFFEIEYIVWYFYYVGYSCYIYVGIMLIEMKEKIFKINICKEI